MASDGPPGAEGKIAVVSSWKLVRIYFQKYLPDEVPGVACEEAKDREKRDTWTKAESADCERYSEWTENVSRDLIDYQLARSRLTR